MQLGYSGRTGIEDEDVRLTGCLKKKTSEMDSAQFFYQCLSNRFEVMDLKTAFDLRGVLYLFLKVKA